MNSLQTTPYLLWFKWLMGIAALLLLVHIGAAPIYILDEAKNAQCAREMWDRGDWILPTFNGALRTDKPALHYWFMRLAYTVGGVGAGQARFFSAILGLGLLALTFYHTRKWAGMGVAFFTTASLVLSTHFLFEFRLSVPDPYLIFFTGAGLYWGFAYLEKGSRISLFIAAASLGLAVLAKGPVALALPGLVMLLYIVVTKKWQVFKDPFILLAGLLALCIAVPWYYWVHVKSDGAFTRGFFLEHNLNRFSSGKEGHGAPFFVTPLIVLIGMLPVSLLTIHALRGKYKYVKEPFFLFSLLTVLVYVVFFSISSTKLPNYPMPCYPFLAVLAGYFLKDLWEGRYTVPTYIWWIWLVFSLAIPIGAYFGLSNEPSVAHLAWLAGPLLLLSAFTLYAYINRADVKKSILSMGLGWIVFSAIFMWVGYPLIYKENPVAYLKPLIKEKATVLGYKSYNPAFNFSFSKGAYVIPMAQSPDSLQHLAEKLQHSSGGRPVYVISRLEFLPELEGTGFNEIGRFRDLFELPTTILLEWKP